MVSIRNIAHIGGSGNLAGIEGAILPSVKATMAARG